MNITITLNFLRILGIIVAAIPMILAIINDFTDLPSINKAPEIATVCWLVLLPILLVSIHILANNEQEAIIAQQDAIYAAQISSEYNLSEETATEIVSGVRAYVIKEYVTVKNKDLVEVVDNKVAVDLETGFVYEADYITTSNKLGLKNRASIEWNKTDKQYEHIELLREVVEEMV